MVYVQIIFIIGTHVHNIIMSNHQISREFRIFLMKHKFGY